MKIKLELTGQTLTPKQKELITEKLEEIRAIVKNKETSDNSRAGRTIAKSLNKLRYENKKEDKQQIKQFVPRLLQSENGTLSQISLYDKHKPEKESPTKSEDFLHGQSHQTERQRARINATLEDLKEECRVLGEALEKGFHLGCKCCQESRNPQLSVSMPFLSQVAIFQGLVSKFLDYYQDTNGNKI